MSPRNKLLFAIACGAIGFFAGAVLVPRGGDPGTAGSWGGAFLGMSAASLGALGGGLGVAIGLILAARRGRHRRPEPARLETPGPSDQVRSWLRKHRRRDAPKRFGKRGR